MHHSWTLLFQRSGGSYLRCFPAACAQLIATSMLVCLFVPGEAFAQSGGKAEAEALFQAGRELANQGKTEEACAKYDASQQLDPALGTLLHLADCYEKIGRTASAWAFFHEAMSIAHQTGQANREQIAQTRAEALEPKLARVELHILQADAPKGLSVTVSGVDIPAASWGLPFPVDPGTRIVRAAAPGYKTWETSVEIPREGGATQKIEVPALEAEPPLPSRPPVAELPPPPRTRPTALPPPEKSSPVQRILGIIGLVAGGAGITAGAALGIAAMVENDASLDECRPDDETLCSVKGVEMRERAGDLALASTIGFAGGAGLGGLGLIVLLTAPRPTTVLTVGVAW